MRHQGSFLGQEPERFSIVMMEECDRSHPYGRAVSERAARIAVIRSGLPRLAGAEAANDVRRPLAVPPGRIVGRHQPGSEFPAVKPTRFEKGFGEGNRHLGVVRVPAAPPPPLQHLPDLSVLPPNSQRAPALHGRSESVAREGSEKSATKGVAKAVESRGHRPNLSQLRGGCDRRGKTRVGSPGRHVICTATSPGSPLAMRPELLLSKVR